MVEKIVEAFENKFHKNYTMETIRQEFSTVEILDIWLEYEGIVGYTRDIVDLLGECDVYIED